MKSFFSTLALVGVLATTASAQTNFYGVNLLDHQFLSIDGTTGLGSVLGTLNSSLTPSGLAAAGGGLFTFDLGTDSIVRLNPLTGATAQTYNVGLSNLTGAGGLAFSSATTGFVFAPLQASTFNPVNALYAFNLTTGTSTLVTNTAASFNGLAFGPDGTLYGLGKSDGTLYTINTATGAMSTVGALTLPDGTAINTNSLTGALSFGADGRLYAVAEDSLFTVNTKTAAAAQVGAFSPPDNSNIGYYSITGLAPRAAAVPEPGSFVLLGLGLLPLAVVAVRRRRSQA